ncbi:uncharacterized protein KNAG_0L00640 [Huiozyma naganishii CBS 8797]|uniref:N-acetyltransferase domain-containing protein n=1 Tax=Huiozyma naganishii (strain ATCC MYA-139 / BCRC 22969 / CBS 8797 / KCTC 17520 / NBRC 10181 / NCYC 3082 / Yp74L-3) TaxID=1071383 RepID=J7S3K9_HUIN7|nr:hypothetical protein KNAG_0L00640 [Kazachstania naganishii CBS 8797]CCK72687.1 hypothetical protein KNAG_0L00640 [Kazachstania naganishii CBS 8797]
MLPSPKHESARLETGTKNVGKTAGPQGGVPLSLTDDVDRASETLYAAFADQPANDYMMRKLFGIPLDERFSAARINGAQHYMNAWYHDHGAEVVEANDFNAVAIFTVPGHHATPPRSGDPTFDSVFYDQLDAAKREAIRGTNGYYYLYVVGRDPRDTRTRGSVRAIFDAYKDRADCEGCAIVLEAINERARRVYEYFGFRTCLTFQFGQGEVNSAGELDAQGEGFTAYLMVYLPEQRTSTK